MAVWRLTIDGKDYYETDLSLGDASRVAKHTGRRDWGAVHPSLGGPEAMLAIVACFLRREDDTLTWEDALEKAELVGFGTLASFVVLDDDDRPGTFQGGLPDPPKGVPATG